MKLEQITLSNIKAFLEGNFRFYLFKFVGAPKHLKEQYAYRLSLCKTDCVPARKCKYCGCPPMKKAFSNESCNKGKRFPNLMSKNQWNEYKAQNNITINE